MPPKKPRGKTAAKSKKNAPRPPGTDPKEERAEGDDAPLLVETQNNEVAERKEGTLKRRKKKSFITPAVEEKFLQHVAKAQDLFLSSQPQQAMAEAAEALKINPTAHLFALMGAIMEQRGDMSRAADFRLLQAFMARDKQLWYELIDEFLGQNMFYRATTCLKRLIQLETEPEMRRNIQLQLADLYLGLDEKKRATTVYLDIWTKSKCSDFEVFSLLSSLYFQQGRHLQLEKLIEQSKTKFQKAGFIAAKLRRNKIKKKAAAQGDDENEESESRSASREESSGRKKNKRGSKKKTTVKPQAKKGGKKKKKIEESDEEDFSDDSSDTEESSSSDSESSFDSSSESETDDVDVSAKKRKRSEDEGKSSVATTSVSQPLPPPVPPQQNIEGLGDFEGDFNDEDDANFGFSTIDAAGKQTQESPAITASAMAGFGTASGGGDPNGLIPPPQPLDGHKSQSATAGEDERVEADEEEGDRSDEEIDEQKLRNDEDAKKEYMMLVNVQAELLIETGKFPEASKLAQVAAAHLGIPMNHLHPDVLVKFCIAQAFSGNCDVAAKHLLQLVDECDTSMFSDVLYDGAEALQKSGRAEDTIKVLHVLLKNCEEKRRDLKSMKQIDPFGDVDYEQDEKDLNDQASAFHYGIGRAYMALGGTPEMKKAEEHLTKVLAFDKGHVNSRIALAGIRKNRGDLSGAADLLFPLKPTPSVFDLTVMVGGDDPFAGIKLDAELIPLLSQLERDEEVLERGVAFFDTCLRRDDDTISIATGATKKRVKFATLPSVLTASSAIIPSASVAGSMAMGTLSTGLAGSTAMTNASLGFMDPSKSVGTAFRAQAPRSSIALAQRGAMTASTIAGQSARTATAGGRVEFQKDGGALYTFHRKAKKDSKKSKKAKRNGKKSLEETTKELREAAREAVGAGDDDQAPPLGQQRPFECKTRKEIMAEQGDFWERCSVGNMADLEAIEELKELEEELLAQKSNNNNGNDAPAVDSDGFALPSAPLPPSSGSAEGVGSLISAAAAKSNGGDEETHLEEDELEPAAPPSLEELAKTFDDPQLANLFVAVTENPKAALTAVQNGDNTGGEQQQQQQQASADPVPQGLANLQETALMQASAMQNQMPTFYDVRHLLGIPKIVDLGVIVINSYLSLDCYAEAQGLSNVLMAFLGRMKKVRNAGDQHHFAPLKLANIRIAVLSGNMANSARFAQELLEFHISQSAPAAVNNNGGPQITMGNSDASVSTTTEDLYRTLDFLANQPRIGSAQTKNTIALIKRHLHDKKLMDLSLLSILATHHYNSGRYALSLQYYLLIQQRQPQDPITYFFVAVSYLLVAMHKYNNSRHACIAHAFAYFKEHLVRSVAASPLNEPSCLFNLARVYHQVSMMHLAVPLYRHAITVAKRVEQWDLHPKERKMLRMGLSADTTTLPSPTSGNSGSLFSEAQLEALQVELSEAKTNASTVRRAAATNLSYIYVHHTGNKALARATCEAHCKLDTWETGMRDDHILLGLLNPAEVDSAKPASPFGSGDADNNNNAAIPADEEGSTQQQQRNSSQFPRMSQRHQPDAPLGVRAGKKRKDIHETEIRRRLLLAQPVASSQQNGSGVDSNGSVAAKKGIVRKIGATPSSQLPRRVGFVAAAGVGDGSQLSPTQQAVPFGLTSNSGEDDGLVDVLGTPEDDGGEGFEF